MVTATRGSRCYPAQGIHPQGCRHGIIGRSRSEAQLSRRDAERRERRSTAQKARRERERIDTLSPVSEGDNQIHHLPANGAQPSGDNLSFPGLTPSAEGVALSPDPADWWFREGWPESKLAQLSPEGRRLVDEAKAKIGPDDMPGGGKVGPRIVAPKARPIPMPETHVGIPSANTPCTCACHPGEGYERQRCDEGECFRLDNPDKRLRSPSPMEGGVWSGFQGKPADFDPHGWDTCEVCNAERWRKGTPLISRRACRARWHPDRECGEGKHVDGEGRYWTDPKYGPSKFPNRQEVAA